MKNRGISTQPGQKSHGIGNLKLLSSEVTHVANARQSRLIGVTARDAISDNFYLCCFNDICICLAVWFYGELST